MGISKPTLILLLYMFPLSLTVANVGGKPIDIVPSDIFLLLVPFIVLFGVKFSRHLSYAGFGVSYFCVLALAGGVLNDGSLSPIFSGLSFVMPMLHIYVGYWFWGKYGSEGFKYFPEVLLFVFGTILFSDLLYGSFPRGCSISGRWGGCIANTGVYGFPNSSMSFIAISSALFFYRVKNANTKFVRLTFSGALMVLGAMTFLSMSRSSSLAFVLVMIVGLFNLWPRRTILSLPVVGMVFYFLDKSLLESSFVFKGLLYRVQSSVERGDVSGGRFDIWWDTLSVISTSPLFGKMFQYYSDFSDFGTAHQQYLEILYKSGLIGFVIYFGLLVFAYKVARKTLKFDGDRRAREVLIVLNSVTFALLVNGLFQPILTYQVVGNLVFCMVGISFRLRSQIYSIK